MASKELKICPFCGSTWVSLDILYNNDDELYHVICDNCGCDSGHGASIEESIESWNTRVE
jgi:Lar family restriction alleviation protein